MEAPRASLDPPFLIGAEPWLTRGDRDYLGSISPAVPLDAIRAKPQIRAMLRPADLKRSDGELASLIREKVAGLEADNRAPQEPRDLALLFELDHQVRNGGFAQYFFNASCLNSFDAWFAANATDAVSETLLGLAFLRLGHELGIDLDIARIVEEGGKALGEAYSRLLTEYKKAHDASPKLLEAFAAFRDRLAKDRDGLIGFDVLNQRFFGEVDIDRAIVEYVRDESSAFVK